MKWIALVFWLFMSSGYLYLLGFAVPKEASLNGYFLFTVLLAGGGLSYDIASKMFSIPSYRGHWKELLTRMGLVLIGHTCVLGGLFVAGYLASSWGEIPALTFGMSISIAGIVLASFQAYKAEHTFKKLRRDRCEITEIEDIHPQG